MKLFKRKKQNSNEFSQTKTKVNIEILAKLLGGTDNIAGVETTYSKAKIFIHERNSVDVEAIGNQKGISGVFASKKYVTIIVGNSSKDLAKKLISL